MTDQLLATLRSALCGTTTFSLCPSRTTLGSCSATAVSAARVGLDVYSWTEKQIVDALRHGLDALDGTDAAPPAQTADIDTGTSDDTAETAPDSLGGKLSDLLERALDQNTRGSRIEIFHRLLDQLVPDEARILGALSDGSRSPVVTVSVWGQSRATSRPVLQNASLIGRTANVALPEMVPQYVSHLLSLGLVDIGPEDRDLETDYELLMAETAVLAAIKNGARGPIPAKVERSTLTLSALGAEFWTAATGNGR
ncbi:Abi-alpha family protein [Mycobacterium kyogaense]|uniref:Abi-alpha family protein n=1 Tax=Mycobacterium kyogaense TaxID=2212479 RepID=UPI002FF834FD